MIRRKFMQELSLSLAAAGVAPGLLAGAPIADDRMRPVRQKSGTIEQKAHRRYQMDSGGWRITGQPQNLVNTIGDLVEKWYE